MGNEVKEAISELGKSVEDFKAEYRERLDKIEAKANRYALFDRASTSSTLAGERGEEVKAFETWARTGEIERKAMSISVDTAGGYAMPRVLADQIYLVGAEQGAIRPLARKYTPESGDFHQPIRRTNAGANRVGETQTRSETTTPSLADFHPMHGGLAAVAPVSNWALNDSKYDLSSFIVESIGEQFGIAESADFVTGTGINQASGFLSYTQAATADATRTWGEIEKLHAGSVSDFDLDDLIGLMGKLAPRYRKRAAWVFHPDTATYIRKIRLIANGEYAWQPSIAAGVPPTLLGLPAYEDVNMPVIASAAAVVALADWSRFYAIVDIGQPTMIRDAYTSKGNTLFYSERRVGGGVLDFNAGKLLVMSA